MITNCELPLCMFDSNLNLNDYDFVLFHLFKSNEQYRDYYLRMRKEHPDRLMILDNSAYELYVKNEKLDLQEFARAIDTLSPDYYILPDVLMDYKTTVKNAENFRLSYGFVFGSNGIHKPQPLAVIQGNTSEELVECMKTYKNMRLRNICIPFHLSFYKDYRYENTSGIKILDLAHPFKTEYTGTSFCSGESEDVDYALGRVMWMMDNKDLIESFDRVHILGSHCPVEIACYKKHMDLAQTDKLSMDTGYPVKLGYTKQFLGREDYKPIVLIDDFFDKELSRDIKETIMYNILRYKRIY